MFLHFQNTLCGRGHYSASAAEREHSFLPVRVAFYDDKLFLFFCDPQRAIDKTIDQWRNTISLLFISHPQSPTLQGRIQEFAKGEAGPFGSLPLTFFSSFPLSLSLRNRAP